MVGRQERNKVSEKKTLRRERRKAVCLLCMFSPVINNLWKTVLTTSSVESCFREMSGKKQTELAGMGLDPAEDWDIFELLAVAVPGQ